MTDRVTTERAEQLADYLDELMRDDGFPSKYRRNFVEVANALRSLADERDELAFRADVFEAKRDKYRTSYEAMQREVNLVAAEATAAEARAEKAEAECKRLAAIVERFAALSVHAEPRHEDGNGTCWAKPYANSQPTRKVYVVDAADFDKAAEAAAKDAQP